MSSSSGSSACRVPFSPLLLIILAVLIKVKAKGSMQWTTLHFLSAFLSVSIIFQSVILQYYYFTLFEIFTFVQKFNFDLTRKIVEFFRRKNSWNSAVLHFKKLTTLISREKLSKHLSEKLVKMLGLTKLISQEKLSVKIEFLDFSNSEYLFYTDFVDFSMSFVKSVYFSTLTF